MLPQYLSKFREAQSGLSSRGRKVFYIHLIYSFLEGIITGAFTLNEFVYLKTLGANRYQVSILFQLAVFVLPLTIFLTHYFNRVKNRSTTLVWMALITRLPLLLLAFYPATFGIVENKEVYRVLFLVIFLFFYFANPVMLPLITQLLKNNYQKGQFARLYGYSQSVSLVAILLSSIAFGLWLDRRESAYVILYPFLGLLGLVSVYIISRIPDGDRHATPAPKERLDRSMISTLRRSYDQLAQNKPFYQFQVGMMLYGIAFLINLPIIALFLTRYLKLSYSEIAIYKGIGVVVAILTFPAFGNLLDRSDPRKFSQWSFGFVLAFFLLLISAYYMPVQFEAGGLKWVFFLMVAYLFFGLFQGSMNILWGIGSAYFAPPNEASQYHATHCSLTGVRGIMAPFLGVVIYDLFGYSGAFGISALILAYAIWLMGRSVRKENGKASEADTDILE